MQSFLIASTLLLATPPIGAVAVPPADAARLAAAARVVQSVKADIATDDWDRAHCIIAFADLKTGVMSCRAGDQWSAPVFMQLAKSSNPQGGAEQADLVLLVMNEEGVQKLLANKVNLGTDASVAAGRVKRQDGVRTDAAATAEILSYSKARGVSAAIDLSGGVLRTDDEANVRVYGTGATPRTVLANREISAPPEASAFLSAVKSVSSPTASAAAATASAPRNATGPTDEDLRARVMDIQESIDRMLADTTPGPVGTSGTTMNPERASGAAVDRDRLLQLRRQVAALLAAMAGR